MEKINRKPFQGVVNIIRFNWHFYVMAALLLVLLGYFSEYPFLQMACWLLAGSVLLSLTASWYIYDRSALYSLHWLDGLITSAGEQLMNVHAGFDETSHLLSQKYPGSKLTVFDFYDPVKHTEVSIERARKVYAAYPGTQTITTANIPVATATADMILVFMAAHEIRDEGERNIFFRELRRSLQDQGRIIVVEHLRDIRNFMVYNLGFLHFFSRSTWQRTFLAAGLDMVSETKITPFLSAFLLEKNGMAS